MGKHGTTPPHVERDYYPTPPGVTNALLEHVDVAGKTVWEPATGTGQMAEVLKAAGAARVIHDLLKETQPTKQPTPIGEITKQSLPPTSEITKQSMGEITKKPSPLEPKPIRYGKRRKLLSTRVIKTVSTTRE
jgi:hypothetical protein